LPVTDEVKLNSNKQRYEESIISSAVTLACDSRVYIAYRRQMIENF
jgi:hypothetical protein